MAPCTWSASPVRRTAMMPISLFTDAWRMSKLTSGNFRDICQMMGFSTWVRVGKVNQQRLETWEGMNASCGKSIGVTEYGSDGVAFTPLPRHSDTPSLH